MFSRIDLRRQKRQKQPSLHHYSSFFRVIFLVVGILVCLLIFAIWLVFKRTNTLEYSRNIVFVPINLDASKGTIILAHISPSETKIEAALFPADMPVEILGGYGTYPLRSVLQLLRLDHKSSEYLRSAYSYALHLPIHDVVAVGQIAENVLPSDMAKLWWQLLSYRVDTSENFFDRLSLYRFSRSLRSDQLNLQAVKDDAEWQKLERQFRIPNVPAECAVAVLNTTDVLGAGSAVAEVLEKSGISVIRLSDTPDRLPQTKLVVTQPLPFCQEVNRQLGSLFPFPTSIVVDSKAMNTYRANIVILVGQDFAQEIAKKSH